MEHDPTIYERWQQALPDSRVASHRRETVWGPLGLMERVYCVNCGKPYGLVTQEFVERVLCLCQACADTHGHLPMPQVPPEEEWAIRGRRE